MIRDTALFVLLVVFLLLSYVNISAITPIVETGVIGIGILATIPVCIAAFNALKKKTITVDLLASVALLFSMIDRQWTSVAFINLMITSARIFGSYTEGKAQSAIRSLLKLRPETVRIQKGNDIVTVSISHVRRGDLVIVRAGDRIPVDGKIYKGQASVDQSSLTGESMPVEKTEGDTVFSSTLNVSGSIIVKAEKIGKDTTLEKIIELVRHAQTGKAGIQTIANTFASWYVLLSFVVSVSLYVITHNVSLVLSILLVTCADDIAVAIPMAFWAAIGYAAKRGIIIKGGNFLEGLTRVGTLVVDKTGTITKGNIAVHDIVGFNGIHTKDVLRTALTASVISKHPVAQAIFTYGMKKVEKKNVTTPTRFQEYPGKGMIVYDGRTKVLIGNHRFFQEEDIPLSYDMEKRMTTYEHHGFTVIAVARSGVCIGMIALADELRDHIRPVIATIKRHGVANIIMLSGDNEQVTRRVAESVGISDFHGNMLPEDKLRFIQKHTGGKRLLAMVGDGVNDAAALTRADIGIAMGVIGSDAAIESSDIALMKDDFSKIPEAMTIGDYTMNIAYQNFVIWALVNIVGLWLVFTRVLGPDGAAAYNFLTDFIPLANSMRIFRFHLFPKLRMRV